MFVTMITIIASANMFGQSYLMTKGAPGTETRTAIYQIAETGLKQFQMGDRGGDELRADARADAQQPGGLLALPRAEGRVMATATRHRPGHRHPRRTPPRPGSRPWRAAGRCATRAARAAGARDRRPLVFMLVTSFKTQAEATARRRTWIPRTPPRQAYDAILGTGETPVFRWFLNSMIAAVAQRRCSSWPRRRWPPTRWPGWSSGASGSSSARSSRPCSSRRSS